MTPLAHLDHPVSLGLPVLLGEPGHVGPLDHFQSGRWIALGIQDPQGLKNRGPVGGPLLVLWHGQPHGQEAPRSPDFVVALGHMAGLASRRSCLLRQNAALFERMSNTVLGRRVHLPLRMVHAHVAGPAEHPCRRGAGSDLSPTPFLPASGGGAVPVRTQIGATVAG